MFPAQVALEPLSVAVKRWLMTGQISQFTEEYKRAFQDLKFDKTKLTQDFYPQDYTGTQAPQTSGKQSQSSKKADKNAQQAAPATLVVGQYKIQPYRFTMKPGEKVKVKVEF